MPIYTKNKITIHKDYLEYEIVAAYEQNAAELQRKKLCAWADSQRKNNKKLYLLTIATLTKPDVSGFRHDLSTLQMMGVDKLAFVSNTDNKHMAYIAAAIATLKMDHPIKVFTTKVSALQWMLDETDDQKS